MELPAFVTAATGMDALTHNIEAYLAKDFHPLSEGIALEGISLINGSLSGAVHKPDLGSRSRMMIASLMGAVAFQKGLGVVHSLAHPLSSLLDTHHGLANAVNLPNGMRLNITGSEDKFRMIARAMELGVEDAGGAGKTGRAADEWGAYAGEAVVERLFDLNRELGLPLRLRDIGVKPEHIATLADLALADFCHPSNPRPVSLADFTQLYKEAL